ncbi:PQQ-dependent sugar dehydrogenase [Candidatus Woesearchaeota archaeon]|nr:MAG: L-sorbosone dehydrogenase [archaeon GW2011_AR18]MBS3161136.1 PQQ-dependent sugar dehydrogenase [Candidatus Woesearchaeota archaeon]HIH26373.1 sorbosone dehydrogenase family protein [Nanoarchaeota archaeon]
MIKKILFLILIIGVVYYAANYFSVKPSYHSEELKFIDLPEGFKITTFADELGGTTISRPGPNPGPRLMLSKRNAVFVTIPSQGKVVALEDNNNDGKAETKKVFIENLNNPHGIDFYEGYYYIAEEDKVVRVKDDNNDNIADTETLQKLLDLPKGGHWTRTLKIINKKLYVSIGSDCNVCEETDKRRSTIEQCELDGSNCKTYSSGLRNTVGFVENKGKIIGVDNGRDGLGDDYPPEEINIIEENKNYGWPNCYGKQIHDTEYDKKTYVRNPCLDTESSFIDLQSHSAPLGLAVYNGNKFPEEYKGKIFIAYHGSWNSEKPTGYKVVTADLETNEVKDFATGWISSLVVKGRPVDIINYKEGLLISDDNAGKIYQVSYEK